MKKWIQAIVKFTSLEGGLFRYALSYGVLLTVFPTLFLIVYLYQIDVLDIQQVLSVLVTFLPEELIAALVNYMMAQDRLSVMSSLFTIVISIGVASQSFYSFLVIVGNDEDFHPNPISIRIKSIFLFLLFILLGISCATIYVLLGINSMFLIPVLLFIVLVVFYHSTTYLKRPIKESWTGAFFASIAFEIYGLIFFWIVQNFTSYASIYGPLSSVLVLILSIYVLCSILYFGYCLNVVFQKSNHLAVRNAWWYHSFDLLIEKLMKKKELK